jgi:hypothetical protein
MTNETEKESPPKFVVADEETVMRIAKECIKKYADVLDNLSKR